MSQVYSAGGILGLNSGQGMIALLCQCVCRHVLLKQQECEVGGLELLCPVIFTKNDWVWECALMGNHASIQHTLVFFSQS